MSLTSNRCIPYLIGAFIGGSLYRRVDTKALLALHSLPSSQLGIANGVLLGLFILFRVVKWVVFGKLNPAEIKHLRDQVMFTAWEFALGLVTVHLLDTPGAERDVYLSSVSRLLKYGGFFLCVLLLKSFHLLCIERVNTVFGHTNQRATLTHLRFALGIVLLHFIDLMLMRRFTHEVRAVKNHDMLLVIFGFEIINQYPLIVLTSIKYVLNYHEFSRKGTHQPQLLNVLEFLVNTVRFLNYCVFSVIFILLFTFPLHILPASYKCLRISISRTRSLIGFTRRASRLHRVRSHFGPVGVVAPDATCTVCYGDLRAASGAPTERLATIRCGHTFHRECITSWLLCSETCPVCRLRLDAKAPHPPPIPL